MRIVLASGNKGKISELDNELKKRFRDIEISGLDSFPDIGHIPETGETFLENALEKARTVAYKTGFVSLADDSGLEVDYLSGRPGVFSARFSGEGASDEENNQKLLDLMQDVPFDKRTARFRCVLVAYSPDDEYIVCNGTWEGKIATEPKGDKGFGYDPLFVDKDTGLTAAEMEQRDKNKVSHRGRAIAQLKEKFQDLNQRLGSKYKQVSS